MDLNACRLMPVSRYDRSAISLLPFSSNNPFNLHNHSNRHTLLQQAMNDEEIIVLPEGPAPMNIATISAGFEKGDFLVREEQGNRVYFDFFEEVSDDEEKRTKWQFSWCRSLHSLLSFLMKNTYLSSYRMYICTGIQLHLQ